MKDKLVEIIVSGLKDRKARNIQIVDMSGIEEAAFIYFVICEGTSSTQVHSIADGLMDYVRDHDGLKAYGSVGMQVSQWVAIDYGYVLVHVFQHETREFYRLESLWADANLTKIPDEL